MFEGSLIESQVTSLSATKRWTMAGSSALQIAIAATLIAVPLLHPERLAFHVETPLVFTPPPPKPPVPVRIQQASASSSTSPAIPVPEFSHLSVIPSHLAPISDLAPDLSPIHLDMADGNAITRAIANTTEHSPRVGVARVPQARPLKVSTGVSAGMLLSPITPIYPSIAKAAGVSGTVVVEAVISKTGTIESLSVVSGPPMLREAALNALRTARYHPYLLNGEPTEIQTTFTVNFRMGS